MVKKIISLLFIASVCLANVDNPGSIHYSTKGNYLEDGLGRKTHLKGHPELLCNNKYVGVFWKAKGRTIYMVIDDNPGLEKSKTHVVKIDKPICYVFDDDE